MLKATLIVLWLVCFKLINAEDATLSNITCERVNDDPTTWRTTCKIPAAVYFQVFHSDFFRCSLQEEVYLTCADPTTRLGFYLKKLLNEILTL